MGSVASRALNRVDARSPLSLLLGCSCVFRGAIPVRRAPSPPASAVL